eukprot:scaffold71571_cov66-Phaeocystis_antarctica.AAC.3
MDLGRSGSLREVQLLVVGRVGLDEHAGPIPAALQHDGVAKFDARIRADLNKRAWSRTGRAQQRRKQRYVLTPLAVHVQQRAAHRASQRRPVEVSARLSSSAAASRQRGSQRQGDMYNGASCEQQPTSSTPADRAAARENCDRIGATTATCEREPGCNRRGPRGGVYRVAQLIALAEPRAVPWSDTKPRALRALVEIRPADRACLLVGVRGICGGEARAAAATAFRQGRERLVTRSQCFRAALSGSSTASVRRCRPTSQGGSGRATSSVSLASDVHSNSPRGLKSWALRQPSSLKAAMRTTTTRGARPPNAPNSNKRVRTDDAPVVLLGGSQRFNAPEREKACDVKVRVLACRNARVTDDFAQFARHACGKSQRTRVPSVSRRKRCGEPQPPRRSRDAMADASAWPRVDRKHEALGTIVVAFQTAARANWRCGHACTTFS